MITATPALGMIKLTDSNTGQAKFISNAQAASLGIKVSANATPGFSPVSSNTGGNPLQGLTNLLPAAGGIAGMIGGGILGDVPGAVAGGATGQGAGQAAEDWLNQNVFKTQKPMSLQTGAANVGESALQGGLFGLAPLGGDTNLIAQLAKRGAIGAGIGAGTAALQANQQGLSPSQAVSSMGTSAALMGALNAVLPGVGAGAKKILSSIPSESMDVINQGKQDAINGIESEVKKWVGANTDAFGTPKSLLNPDGSVKTNITDQDLPAIHSDYTNMIGANKDRIATTLTDLNQYAPTHNVNDVVTELNDAIDLNPADTMVPKLRATVGNALAKLQGNSIGGKLVMPGTLSSVTSKPLTLTDLQSLKDSLSPIYTDDRESVVTDFYTKINQMIKRDLDTAENKAAEATNKDGVPYKAVRANYEKLNSANQELGKSSRKLYDVIHNPSGGVPKEFNASQVSQTIRQAMTTAAKSTPLMMTIKGTALPLKAVGFLLLHFIGYILGGSAETFLAQLETDPEMQLKFAQSMKNVYNYLNKLHAYNLIQQAAERGITSATTQ